MLASEVCQEIQPTEIQPTEIDISSGPLTVQSSVELPTFAGNLPIERVHFPGYRLFVPKYG
jgi:hypothetical protein